MSFKATESQKKLLKDVDSTQSEGTTEKQGIGQKRDREQDITQAPTPNAKKYGKITPLLAAKASPSSLRRGLGKGTRSKLPNVGNNRQYGRSSL